MWLCISILYSHETHGQERHQPMCKFILADKPVWSRHAKCKHTGSSLAVLMKCLWTAWRWIYKSKACKPGNYYIMVHKYITCKDKISSQNQFITYSLLYQSKELITSLMQPFLQPVRVIVLGVNFYLWLSSTALNFFLRSSVTESLTSLSHVANREFNM